MNRNRKIFFAGNNCGSGVFFVKYLCQKIQILDLPKWQLFQNVLDKIFVSNGFDKTANILDCACGIGTQAIGLAAIGYNVTGSDISEGEILEAKERAKKNNVEVRFEQANFCALSDTFVERFDIVIAMDNALPHMLTSNDLASAIRSIVNQIKSGGIFAASIRDYDALLMDKPPYSPPYIHKTEKGQRVSFQTWTWEGDNYRLIQYIVDDEGTLCRDAVIIKDGVLTGYMNNLESALHFGVKPCGNARAFAFSDEPLIRMRNTAIHPGTDKLSDMIASVDKGYYLTRTQNGQADTTGEFMFGITMGYEIVNGKLGRALRDTTISGVAFNMLKTVDMLSDDIAWDFAGYCGKKQPMPVSMGGPSIRCKVNIGGR